MAIHDIRDRFAGRRAARKQGVVGSREVLDRIHAEPAFPPGWLRRLRQVSPVSETMQWLQARMFPVQEGAIDPVSGRKLEPVWVLYTMTPASLITDESKLAQLSGQPWWELPKDQQYGRMVTTSSYQWEMFRQFQCWARPYWAIQGEKGGTPMSYSPWEAAMLKAHGLPADVPNPGSLPFAPFDERVVEALQARDRMRIMGSQWAYMSDPSKAALDVKAEDEAAEKAGRVEFVKWFEERMAPNGDFIDWHTKKAGQEQDFRPASKAEEKAAATWKDTYISTGQLPVEEMER